MATKKILDDIVCGVRIRIELMECDSSAPHDYGISRSAWLRAIRFVERFGVVRALEIIDERAERAVDRQDFKMAYRWRDFIVAIHAMTEEEMFPGDCSH